MDIHVLKEQYSDGKDEQKNKREYVFENMEEPMSDGDDSSDGDDPSDGNASSDGEQEDLILVHEHRYAGNDEESRSLFAVDRNLVIDLEYLKAKIVGVREEYKWVGTYKLEFKGIRFNQQTGNFEKETICHVQPETLPVFLKRVFHIDLYQIRYNLYSRYVYWSSCLAGCDKLILSFFSLFMLF